MNFCAKSALKDQCTTDLQLTSELNLCLNGVARQVVGGLQCVSCPLSNLSRDFFGLATTVSRARSYCSNNSTEFLKSLEVVAQDCNVQWIVLCQIRFKAVCPYKKNDPRLIADLSKTEMLK